MIFWLEFQSKKKKTQKKNLLGSKTLPGRIQRSPFMLRLLPIDKDTSEVHFREILSGEAVPEATLDLSYTCNLHNCSAKTNEKLD